MSDSIHSLFHQIMKINFHKTHHYLEQFNLHPGQPPVLFYIRKNPGASQRDIAKHLLNKPSTINVMISRLERSGFITKEIDSIDRRLTHIYLSEKGHSICNELEIIFKQIEQDWEENFSPEEEATLKELLSRLKEHLHH